jgi:hypothetical protein
MAVVESLTVSDILVICAVVALCVGVTAHSKINQYLHGRQVKNEIRQEFLDKEQTKELHRIHREIDDIKRTK